jgi:alpha-tubulin suppressor-like RCC1 family protein
MTRVRRVASSLAVLLALSATAAANASASGYGATGWGANVLGASWGSNGYGELGNGTTKRTALPTVVKGLSGVTAVAAGESFGLALLSTGKVMAWGQGSHGQLGDGSTSNSHVPVEVKGLKGVVQIAAGTGGIAAGAGHALALLENGKVMAWGANAGGQLGNGTTVDSDEPVEVSGLSKAVAIGASSESSYAVLESGAVVAWGLNGDGQLGDSPSREGEKLTGPELCGGWACSRTPVEVSGVSEAIAVAGGGTHAFALLRNHTLEAWGGNGNGTLGVNSETGPETCRTSLYEWEPCSTSPVLVAGLGEHTVTAVAAGRYHSLALLSSGHVMAWGSNGYGQLGIGSYEPQYAPAEVRGLSNATAISAGDSNSVALLAGGTVEEWGNEGGYRELREPAEVRGLAGVAGVSAGGFSLAYGAPGPTITLVEPSSGPPAGGTSVRIHGSEFTSSMTLRFGEEAVAFEYVSSTEVIVKSPAQKPGSVNVTAEHDGRSDVTSESEFTYAPEGNIDFGRCIKVTGGTGEYKTNTCTEALAGGGFKWVLGAEKKKFTSADATETVEREVEGKIEKVVQPKKVIFETTGRVELVCKNEGGAGEYTNKGAVTGLVLAFTGCEYGGAKCSSPGAAEGELVTSALEGLLGWREREANKVALDLKPAGEEVRFIEATCGTASVDIRGRVIATVTSIDKMAGTFTLTFAQTNGKQAVEELEGEKEKEVLEMSISTVGFGAYLQTGLKLDSKLTNEENLEINTVA